MTNYTFLPLSFLLSATTTMTRRHQTKWALAGVFVLVLSFLIFCLVMCATLSWSHSAL